MRLKIKCQFGMPPGRPPFKVKVDFNHPLDYPELKTYLDTRQTSNFTRKDYAGEPHDERHEEYNKRGLNMQRVKTANSAGRSLC